MGNIKQQYEKNRKCNYQLLRCKKNITCVNNKDIFIQASNELKESKRNRFSHHLFFQLFNLSLNYGGNKNIKNVFELVKIFLVIILQFSIVMAQDGVRGESSSSSKGVTEEATGFFGTAASYIALGVSETVGLVENHIICPIFQQNKNLCEKKLLTLPITILLFIISFSIFYCILSKCIRHAKIVNKRRKWKKQIEEYDRQIEQMSQNNYLTEMNDGNYIQSQMLQGPMFPPQMPQGPMFPPQMFQGQAQLQIQQALKQQHELQEQNESEDSHKSGHENSNNDTLQVE